MKQKYIYCFLDNLKHQQVKLGRIVFRIFGKDFFKTSRSNEVHAAGNEMSKKNLIYAATLVPESAEAHMFLLSPLKWCEWG